MKSGLGWQTETPKGPCLYLLWLDNKVVYAGQTTNAHTRIQTHRRRITFDEVLFLPTTANHLKAGEKLLIERFKPALNTQWKGDKQPFTLWLSHAMLQKLNRIAKARSTDEKLYNRADIVRELVARAKL